MLSVIHLFGPVMSSGDLLEMAIFPFALQLLISSMCEQIIIYNALQYEKENVVEAKFRELEQDGSSIKPSDKSLLCTLKTNTDLLACKAEYYHQCCEYQKCFELTST